MVENLATVSLTLGNPDNKTCPYFDLLRIWITVNQWDCSIGLVGEYPPHLTSTQHPNSLPDLGSTCEQIRNKLNLVWIEPSSNVVLQKKSPHPGTPGNVFIFDVKVTSSYRPVRVIVENKKFSNMDILYTVGKEILSWAKVSLEPMFGNELGESYLPP